MISFLRSLHLVRTKRAQSPLFMHPLFCFHLIYQEIIIMAPVKSFTIINLLSVVQNSIFHLHNASCPLFLHVLCVLVFPTCICIESRSIKKVTTELLCWSFAPPAICTALCGKQIIVLNDTFYDVSISIRP